MQNNKKMHVKEKKHNIDVLAFLKVINKIYLFV